MTDITAEQISDLREDLGIDSTVLTDPKIQRLWARVSGAANTTAQYYAMLALAAMQLRNNAASLHDYTAGMSQEKLSQVFDHLKAVYDEYRPYLERAMGQKRQFSPLTVRPIPRQGRSLPAEDVAASWQVPYADSLPPPQPGWPTDDPEDRP